MKSTASISSSTWLVSGEIVKEVSGELKTYHLKHSDELLF
jgi:hypothetical protein